MVLGLLGGVRATKYHTISSASCHFLEADYEAEDDDDAYYNGYYADQKRIEGQGNLGRPPDLSIAAETLLEVTVFRRIEVRKCGGYR